jgi:hypothetical protein
MLRKLEEPMESSDTRIKALESALRRTRVALALLSLFAAVVFIVDRPTNASANTARDAVLRLRGLIIEDEHGNPRLLLGAPIAPVYGRKRTDLVDGIVLLGENGADRVVINYHGYEPQVENKVEKRSTPASAGLIVNDANGDERAGLGVSDDGTRISLGMDYPDRDALGLLVSPGFSGVVGFGRAGERSDQFALGVQKDGTATFKLADSNGDEGVIADVHKGPALKVQIANPATHKLEDLSEKILH